MSAVSSLPSTSQGAVDSTSMSGVGTDGAKPNKTFCQEVG